MSEQATSHTNTPLLSVIITAHAEGSLMQKTLESVRRSIQAIEGSPVVEIILHVDNPTQETGKFIDTHRKSLLKEIRIFTNKFGDLGSSRNFAINHATGKYISTIDADDLMSEHWLGSAIQTLEKSSKPTIAHSELTIEFEGANGLIIKHSEIDKTTDTLLSVYANRWNSVIIAPRKLLLKFPYTPNSPGYGYEDWHLNCRLIEAGIHNVLIPQTAIFVRRKRENSEWLRQKQSMAVLRANPLLSLSNVRALKTNPFSAEVSSKKSKEALGKFKSLLRGSSFTRQVVRHIQRSVKGRRSVSAQFNIPKWLESEWKNLHDIESKINLTPELACNLPVYDTLTLEHRVAGGLYKKIADALLFDEYDYLLFVPWLIKGGADRYSINYANTIASLKPSKRVLVVATLPVLSIWKNQLDKSVDFLDFGMITQGASSEIQYRLLSHLIENIGITHLHVINSELGYDFVRLHEKYIQATNKKVVATAFSQSIGKDGHVFGYSHTHVPNIYHLADLITSDNQAVLDMWKRRYKFESSKLAVHRQPVTNIKPLSKNHSNHKPLRVLWAARIAPEKLPELLKPIGQHAGKLITIDVYGTVDPQYKRLIKNLPKNVHFRGGFDGFTRLPLDNYDCLLYTSLFDGMPNTILDAASNGLPIIASAVGGVPEFVINDETGLLVSDIKNVHEYVAALNLIANYPDLGVRLATNAQSYLRKHFSPSFYRDQVGQMLKKIRY